MVVPVRKWLHFPGIFKITDFAHLSVIFFFSSRVFFFFLARKPEILGCFEFIRARTAHTHVFLRICPALSYNIRDYEVFVVKKFVYLNFTFIIIILADLIDYDGLVYLLCNKIIF